MLAALWLAVWCGDASSGSASAQTPKRPVRCPQGCTCTGPGLKGCRAAAVCSDMTTFPSADRYPYAMDCLTMSGAALQHLSARDKETGLRALPLTLRHLDLAGCGLGALPDGNALGRLHELRVLGLEFNALRRLPEAALHGLRSLKVLRLSGNSSEGEAVGGRTFLSSRGLANSLTGLRPQQFRGLGTLQVLRLDYNSLTALPEDIFVDQHLLTILKLQGNNFSPALTRQHPALLRLLTGLPIDQLDLHEDSGTELEDYWEQSGAYLIDDPHGTTVARDEL